MKGLGNTWFSFKPQWYVEVNQYIFQKHLSVAQNTLLSDWCICMQEVHYNERNCLLCSQKWLWCVKIIPFYTLSSRKVSIRVLESECFSLMHDDLVKMLTKRWQVSILCMGHQALGCQKHDPLLCLPSFLSRRWSEGLVQENVLKKWKK